MDQYQDLRSEMVKNLEKCGIKIEVHHHEVGHRRADRDRHEIHDAHQDGGPGVVVQVRGQNTARKRGKVVTVMPKPLFQDNGSGMHTHQSLWKNGKNLFYDKKGYGLISDMARYYIGGLIKHAHALCGFIAPTTNSYEGWCPATKRRSIWCTRPVTEAPVLESRCIRPVRRPSGSNSVLPIRSCNPYFAFPAMLMAGLDGVRNKIEPPKPIDKDLYELEPEEAAK